jgi:transcriptional regulator with XRE-family HTH domain
MPDAALTSNTHDSDRRRAVGSTIRGAREQAGRKPRDLAAQIGITTPALLAIESGERDATLPQLEAIAYLLNVPVQALLQASGARLERGAAPIESLETIIRLRGYIVGARLKAARMALGESAHETMAATGIGAREIEQFEIGARQPGLGELERLTRHFGLGVEDLLDLGVGPLGETQLRQRQQAAFDALPEELRTLISSPNGAHQLELARRISALSPDQLRELSRAFAALADERGADASNPDAQAVG